MEIDMGLNAEPDWRVIVDDLLSLGPREAICLLSTDLRIVHINTAWIHLFGFLQEEAIGSPWAGKCCGQATSLGEMNNLNAAIATCQHAMEQITCYRKDGGQFQAFVAVAPIGSISAVGLQTGESSPGVLVALLIRDLPAEYSEALHLVSREQLLYSAYLAQQALQALVGGPSAGGQEPPPMAQPPPAVPSPLAAIHPDEAPTDLLLLLLQKDDYVRLRGMLLTWGAAALQRLAGLVNLSCPLCPMGHEFAAAVQGNLAAVWHAEGGAGALRTHGMTMRGLDVLQYALCHASFRVAVLLIVAGFGKTQGRCVLTTATGREVVMGSDDLCALYSRSYATNNPSLSNSYAQAAFTIRRWPELSLRLGVDPANALAGVALAGEDGDTCVQAVSAVVQERVAQLHRAFMLAAIKPRHK